MVRRPARYKPSSYYTKPCLLDHHSHQQPLESWQRRPLDGLAGRLGWTVVAIYRDEGISGSQGRDKRPALDALLKGVARREFDIVAAWSVCRLGRPCRT
jgi:DNA invertase Pin-like site-specific DNA recombinase